MTEKMVSRSTAIAAMFDVINNDVNNDTIETLIETVGMLTLEIQGIDAWGITSQEFKKISENNEKYLNTRRLGQVPLCHEDAALLSEMAI